MKELFDALTPEQKALHQLLMEFGDQCQLCEHEDPAIMAIEFVTSNYARFRAVSLATAYGHEKPMKPGSYWMQESSGVTGIVEVREAFDGQKATGRFEWLNGYGWHPVDEKEAAWAGPIPEPEAAPAAPPTSSAEGSP